MRRKLRDVERDLATAGCSRRSGRGKGSHELWIHLPTETNVLIPRPKGDLLPDYVDRNVRQAIQTSQKALGLNE